MRGPKWTEEDKARLRFLAGDLPVEEIAKFLSRTPKAVKVQGFRMGLQLNRMFNNNVKAQRSKEVMELSKTKSIKEIAKITGLTYHQVYAITTNKPS